MNELLSTKLFNVLSAFSQSEWRVFRDFLSSGLGGPPGKSLMLLDYFMPFVPDLNHPDISKKAAFQAIYPGKQYEDKKLRYALTDLYKQSSSFLTFRSLNNQPLVANSLLKEVLVTRGADKAYLSLLQKDEGSNAGVAPLSTDRYYYMYRDSFIHMNHYLPRQKRTGESPIGDVARNLDVFYISKKLQLLCELINLRNVMSVEFDFLLQDELTGLLKSGAFADVVLISIYFRILMTLTEPDDESHFVELDGLLSKSNHEIERDELKMMYQYQMNYCIKKINLGNTAYVSTLLKIYKTVLEREVIFTDNYLSQWDYKNIVVIGIRAGEPDWVKEFIQKYKNKLTESERDNAYAYNMAYLNFGTGNYKQALSMLQQVEFTDLYYQLDMRAIILKCYYEMNDDEALSYHLSAFRIFLSRNKLVSEYQRTIYRNLIRFTSALLRSGGRKGMLEKLSQNIEDVKQVADLNWVRKKLSEQLELVQ